MSVQLLSSLPDPEDSVVVERDAAPFKEEKFDALFESAWDRLEPTLDQPPRSRKSLDQLIGEGLDRQEAAEADEQEFRASRESRDELNARYGSLGDMRETLNRFIGVAGALAKDPTSTAMSLAENYFLTAHSLPARKAKAALPEAEIDERTGRRETGRRLDAIIDDAIETAGSEAKDFEATTQQRAALRKIFPNMSVNEAMAKVVEIDTELRNDPIHGAAKLAAAYGMAVTPRQQEHAGRMDDLSAKIDAAAPHMPGLNEKAVIDILNRPDFVRTGDHMADLNRAHQITQVIARRDAQTEQWAQAQLQQMEPAMAQKVLRVIYGDERFKSQARRMAESRPFGDPTVQQLNFQLAVGIAQAQSDNVAKARRAAPLRSSSRPTGGVDNRRSGSGIDAAIERALANY